MKHPILLLTAILTLGLIACNQQEETCLDFDTTASFTIDGTVFSVTHTPVWISDGIYQSLGFRHDLAGGGQELITILFEGDTAGTYPLAGVSDPNRGTYMGASSGNNILFTGPQQSGTLTVTDMDLDGGCLSGHYSYTANYVVVTGEFESLRPD